MRLRKIAAALLCALLASVVLVGCSQTPKSPFVSDDAARTETPASDTTVPPSALNIEGAYAALDPKTVMVTVNGDDVTWDAFFYYIYLTIQQFQSQGYPLNNLSEIYADEMTYKDYILENATMFVLQNAAMKNGAAQMGVSLTEADKAAVQASWDKQAESMGGEEALVAQLQADYCNKDLLMENLELPYLFNACFAAMYGSDGSGLSDEEVYDYTAKDGYLMAKHILMLTTTADESGKDTPLPDDKKAEVRAKMEGILAQINSYSGNDFDSFFDGLMREHSQDPGALTGFPDGYLFQDGDMVNAFFDATQALEIGKVSGIIESEYGYHIIYRIPINYDTIPIRVSQTSADSLRMITARNMFYSVFDTWLNSLDVINSDQYKSLDLDKLFAAG